MSQSIKWNLVMCMKNKQLFVRIFFATVFVAGVSACSTTLNNAPVVDRGVERTKPEIGIRPSIAAKQADKLAAEVRNSYTVKKGDTLFRIALDHGQSYSDIVGWNSLKNPNDIKIDQVLWVAPPETGANNVVQAASVGSGSGIEIRSLSTINSAINKTSPHGEKRPYSEINLVELQKPDSVSIGVNATLTKVEGGTIKSTEKAMPQPSLDSDAVDWIWPTEGKVVANFDDMKNKGMDISGKLGQDVVAASSGKVMYEGSGIRGYGNLVIIKHTNNLLSAYAHNKINLVKEGQTISKGQKIAEMGNSDTDAIKLHFEIRQQGKPVDPSRFLPGR